MSFIYVTYTRENTHYMYINGKKSYPFLQTESLTIVIKTTWCLYVLKRSNLKKYNLEIFKVSQRCNHFTCLGYG